MCNKPTWDAGSTIEKLVNNLAPACDLQAFWVFSQHPTWGYYTIEMAVYCFKTVKATSPPQSACYSTSRFMCSGHVVVINDWHNTNTLPWPWLIPLLITTLWWHHCINHSSRNNCYYHKCNINFTFSCFFSRFSLFGELFDEAIRNGLTALQVCKRFTWCFE